MLTISLFGPIASAIICLYLGRYLGAYAARLMLILYITSAVSAITLCYFVVTNQSSIIISMFSLSTILGTSFEVGVTNLDSILLAIILLVSTTVNTYSIYYMDTDAYYIRFIGLMSAFASYMCILVVSTNILTLFICWELIGIFSYLLISYWSDRYIAIIASLKAIAMNKIGDYGYTIGLILLIIQLDSTELSIINNMYTSNSDKLGVLVLCLFVIAASAKSAQLFLHNWLADAMQGPTPVSALLHAATLVVAGPILLAKLYMFTSYGVLGIQLLGMSTAMLGACIAIGNTDAKTIIAYSTMSQFGYIISISTIWTSSVAYLHISTHACFKAALFMCAGVIIHSSFNMQDYRLFGAIARVQPITYIAILASSSSLIAIPYLSGCVSKDLIIEVHSSQYSNYNSYVWLTSLVVACLTAIYSIRLVIYCFITSSNNNRKAHEHMHEASNYALIPISTLCVLGILLGYFLYSYVVDAYTITDSLVIAELWQSSTIKTVPLVVVLLGLLVTAIVYRSHYVLPYGLNRALYMRLYFDSMYAGLHYGYLRFAQFIANTIDLGIIELVTARAMTFDKALFK